MSPVQGPQSEQKLRDYLNRVTIDLRDTRRRLREAEARSHEPIAVVSMSCRFPGGVRTPEELWDLLVAGRDTVTGVPGDRGWDTELLTADGVPCRGAFLDGAADFDAEFFAVSPHEAVAMDPQQRLLLQAAWEAIERAGIDPASLRASRTGVFAAAIDQGYAQLGTGAPDTVRGFLMTGNSMSVMSGRVAYALGLEGPAVTVDTACSASLVALHQAARALRADECSLALTGGVTVMSRPSVFTEFSRQGAMSGDGRCKPFSAAADGTGWGEGVGVLLLERLSDARRHGHPVLAVLRGSAVNQDGASNGLTAPNGPSQQRVIQAALADAGLAAQDVDAVEAHGTGTTLGDPIEADALLATYGRGRPAERPLWLGSLKSNIGHTQAAAGVAGVIKTVLALRHGLLPRSLHITEPTPHADWAAGAVSLLTEARQWPATDRPRRAGVSSFGMSGTNAHVILEQAPEPPEQDPGPEPRPTREAPPAVPCLLSGRTAAALRDQAVRLKARVAADPRARPVDIGHALATTRTAFTHRAAVTAADRDELLSLLTEVARDPENAAAAVTGTAEPAPGRIALVFPGQGSQWPGMGGELLDSAPEFARSMAACEDALAPHVDWSLRDVVRAAPGAAPLDRVDVVQPALFATMVSLAALWRSWGVVPDAVVGHSQGEIAAAVVAGALSLADGAKVVALRSRAIAALAGDGGMVSLAVPRERADELIAPWGGRLSVAALNGPAAVVVSGDAAALAELTARCAERAVRARTIPVDYASHSAHVERVEDEILTALAGITPAAARIPLLSTVTGEWLDTTTMDAAYWYRNLRGTVRFAPAVRALAEQGHGVFLEVSPHPVLTGPVQDTAEAAGAVAPVVTGTLRRDEGGLRRALTSAAELWVRGVPVRWSRVYEGRGARRVDLPTYPFQQRRHWLTPATPDAERRTAADPYDDWRYRVDWQPVPDPAAPALDGTWLVLTPEGYEENGTVRALREHGAEVLTAEVTVTGDGDGDGDSDRVRLAEALTAAADGRPLAGVLSLLGLDDRPHPRHPGLPTGTALTLALVQALGDLGGLGNAGVDAPLWCATRGAVSTGAGDPVTAPAQAQVWGTGMVAALEHPRRWGGLVDLPEALDARAGERLCAALGGVGGEDQLAVRTGGLYARRLVRAPRPAARPGRTWRPRGTVLLTGGTGALGPHLARWLARAGADRLVLPGRRGADAPGAAELTAELAAFGTTVTMPCCDLADRAQVERLLAELDAQGTPVTAVVHAAAYIALAPLDTIPVAAYEHVVAAKAAGAAHLDALLDRELDAFVLFSSIAGVWGSGDHGAYSAANAHLDALAQHRRGRGLTATTVDWGIWRAENPWAPPATGADADLFNLEEHGLPRIDAERALAALQHILDDDETLVTVADVDWAQFAPVFTSGRPSPLLTGVAEARRALAGQDGDDRAPAAAELRGRLAALRRPADRSRLLLGLVREHAAAVLGHDSADAVPPGRAFQELGFASLTAVELRNRLTRATGLRLPSTLVFDHPSATALADHLGTRLLGAEEAEEAEEAARETREPVPGAADEPLAVVSMGCRLPGGITTPDALWRLLADRGDAVTGFPTGRGWDLDALYDPDPENPGTVTTRHGGFLHDAADFDPAFFGISPREALAMDPQQRLLLETSWEALERAGLDPQALRGSRTGVFTGVNYSDYASAVARSTEGEGHLLTGSAPSVVSGRVAYTLGLEGPAVTVDTACSSSLVALHLAARALRAGDCSLALVGGVAVMATPGALVSFSRQRGLAADGRCKAFGDTADGMGMSEGAGVLLVERLSDARRHGHPVLAVLRGSAVNQDGASNGLSAPNGPSQQRVIRAALADAGLSGADVDVVEAHGTGTTLGDPIEAQALLATYGQDRPEGRPLLVGSLKSNIGHTQALSGVAGVMKTVLALRHATVPATLHAEKPTTHVDWSAGDVALVTEAEEWPDTGRPRRAGVSSFGLSGTNAHVVLEQAPEPAAPESERTRTAPALPWILSARSADALRDQAGRLLQHLTGGDGPTAAYTMTGTGTEAEGDAGTEAGGCTPDPVDVALSLTGRTAFPHRAVLVGGHDRLLPALREWVTGAAPAVTGLADPDARTVLMFPGQGSQWTGMARQLLDEAPEFAEALHACAAALAPHVEWSLLDVVRDGTGLDRVDVVQPVLFAVMVSLARLWRAYGVVPDAVVGHSQGEIAAAVVAGALTLEDGAKVVALRSRAIARLAGHGGMVSLALPAPRATDRIAAWAGRLSVAAVNGPSAVVVSGDADALDELMEACAADGVRARRVDVTYASHCAHMDRLEAELLSALKDVEPATADVPLYSTVTDEWLDTSRMDARYWYANLRRTVGFESAVRALAAAGHRTYIEVSPHPVLTPAVEETLESAGADAAVLGTLRRGEGGTERLLRSLGEAWAHGVPVDWSPLFAGTGARRVELPTYAFQHQAYWAVPGPETGGDVTAAGLGSTGHPLLAAAVELAETGEILLSGRISVRSHPWLADHAVSGVVLLPGAAFVDLAVRAGDEAGCPVVEELTLQAPLVLPASGGVRLQVRVGAPDATGRRTLDVHARPEDATDAPWTAHATGTLAEAAGQDTPAPAGSWPPAGAEPVDVGDLYARFAASGYGYGPAFQGLRTAWRRGGDLFTEVSLGQDQHPAAAAFGIHPALLDAALQGLWLAPGTASGPDLEPGTARLPFAWTGVTLHASGATELRVRLTQGGDGSVSLTASDPSGRPVATVTGLAVRAVDVAALRGATAPAAHDSLYRLEWTAVPAPAPAGPVPPARWAALGPGLALPDTYPGLAGLAAAVDRGAPVPDVVLVPRSEAAGDDATAVHTLVRDTLTLLKDWLADDRFADARLVFLTSGAVCAGPGDAVSDPAAAALRGLVRSAQSEHPDRFVLADAPDHDALLAVLPGALDLDEPQIAVRGEEVRVARLARVEAPEDADEGPVPFDPDGTVLITGAGGALGGLVARHLAARHGVRRLLLAGRRGAGTPGADALLADLRALGAQAEFAACDVAEPDAVARLVAGVPAAHPLTAVVHAAGVLDDGVLASLTPERLDRVLRPKVDGALALHGATRGLPLSAFVLFSSAAGVIGNAGQANYAAANGYLDALAQHRRAAGLPAQSLAWGLWEQAGDMTGTLDATGLRRMTRGGVTALSDAQGLALFDAALRRADALLVPVRLDAARLRAGAASGTVPPLLRGLVRAARPAATGTDATQVASLREQLAGLGAEERRERIEEVVRARVADVLGHGGPDAIDPEQAFKDLGFDSLTAVDLRNRLNAATGLRLPATLVFDHPTPAAAAAYVTARLAPATAPAAPRRPDGDRELQRRLAAVPVARLREAGLLDALLRLTEPGDRAPAGADGGGADPADDPAAIREMELDGLVRMALGGGDRA
ncbi:Erythronolide synthase, modules 3 and 4 [Streptomyces sp. YIM 121038]|uniref:SDR family NAD(P)-dependent oxidoreductase n=1 Tax=Streptomyces sp. YIM 121038 TaxID=2136401 RepID=UPI001165AD19|nr:type I polyketide synthase [Streptomyces sp. YIM 121038]QCX74519.1 Erythronolide synthase, modules 3 and 4 [Streptomyces sp. YIM 121038]